MKKTIALILTLILALSLVTVAGGGASAEAYAEHVTVAVDTICSEFNPSTNVYPILNTLVYDTLIYWNKTEMKPEPALATAWNWVDENATILHLDLREGVCFSNGNPFTAQDVEYTLSTSGYANLSKDYDYCEIINDYSLDIHLKSGNADYDFVLSSPYSSIVDKESCEADATNGTAIGTGAWIVDKENTMIGDTIELVRNDNYWGEVPVTKLLTLRYISSSSSRLLALQNKEIAAYMTVGETDVDIVEADPNLQYCSGAGVGDAKLYYVGFNMKSGACKDNIYLRQAIACAINQEDVIAAVGDRNAIPSDGAFWGYSCPFRAPAESFQEDLSFDLEHAKELVEKAKELAGGELPTLTFTSNTTKAINMNLMLVLQEDCRQIGIDLEIVENDSAGITAKKSLWSSDEGAFDIITYNVPLESYASAVNRMYLEGSSNNRAFFADDHITELLQTGAGSSDTAVREQAYQEVQVYTHDNAIYVPVYYGSRDGAQLNGVEGIIWANDGFPEFKYVRVPA